MAQDASFANLQRFIASQRAHLERTRADIEKLDRLRERVRRSPEQFIENLSDELDDPAFRRPSVEYLRLPVIDWSLVSAVDLKTFEKSRCARTHHPLAEDHQNPLRDKVSKLVVEAGFTPLERPTISAGGIYIDTEDDTMWTQEREDAGMETGTRTQSASRASVMPRDVKVESRTETAVDADSPRDNDPSHATPSQLPLTTHNVPWTTTEQRLLEKHLALIPSTVNHRWAKISQAMKDDGADRGPRQVASRVQKMFAKMKKMGVEAHGGLAAGDVGDGGIKRKRKEEREAKGKAGREVDGRTSASAKLEKGSKANGKPKPKQRKK